MKILQFDSPLMRFLSKLADFLIIDLLTLFLCVPIITGGAAITALNYCALKIVRDDEDGIFKMYFRSFKQNFRQSTVIWLICLLVGGFLGFDFYMLYADENSIAGYLFWGLVLAAALLLFLMSTVFLVQSKFVNPVLKTIKSAFVLSLRNFPITLLVVLSMIAIPVLCFFAPVALPIGLCSMFSFPAFVAAKFYDKPFKAMEKKFLDAHPELDPSANDEHIFSDEPIEGNAENR